jgi:hypothetical protein
MACCSIGAEQQLGLTGGASSRGESAVRATRGLASWARALLCNAVTVRSRHGSTVPSTSTTVRCCTSKTVEDPLQSEQCAAGPCGPWQTSQPASAQVISATSDLMAASGCPPPMWSPNDAFLICGLCNPEMFFTPEFQGFCCGTRHRHFVTSGRRGRALSPLRFWTCLELGSDHHAPLRVGRLQ